MLEAVEQIVTFAVGRRLQRDRGRVASRFRLSERERPFHFPADDVFFIRWKWPQAVEWLYVLWLGLAALFGLGQPGAGTAEVVWSKSVLTEGRSATRAVHHGDFDNDAPTMNSVMRRVLGLDDADPLPVTFPVAGTPGRPAIDGGRLATAIGMPPGTGAIREVC